MINLMREGDTVSSKLIKMGELVNPDIEESDYGIMSASMASSVFFTMVICLLYSAVV